MQSMVLEVLIAFGLCAVAEVAFQLADGFDCRRQQKRNQAMKQSGKHDPLSLPAR